MLLDSSRQSKEAALAELSKLLAEKHSTLQCALELEVCNGKLTLVSVHPLVLLLCDGTCKATFSQGSCLQHGDPNVFVECWSALSSCTALAQTVAVQGVCSEHWIGSKVIGVSLLLWI